MAKVAKTKHSGTYKNLVGGNQLLQGSFAKPAKFASAC